MAKYEGKFFVINWKRFDELNERNNGSRAASGFREHPAIAKLKIAIHHFIDVYERETGKKMAQDYYVCNQDEPYAPEIIKTILEGEDQKLNCRVKPQPENPEVQPMGGDMVDAFESLVDVILIRYSLRQKDSTTMEDVLSVNSRIKEHKLIVSNEVMKLIRRLH